MKKLTLALCSIIALLLISATTYVLLTPKRVTPLKLPVTKKSLGRTVTLKSVKRVSKDVVQVTLETENPQSIIYVDSQPEATIPGDLPEKECEEASGGLGVYVDLPRSRERETLTANFKVPEGVSTINLSRIFVIERPSKRVNVNFKDIPVTSLPITKSFNGTAVTLHSVMVNKAVDPAKWELHRTRNGGIAAGSPCFALQIKISTRQNFIHTADQQLGDERGNTYSLSNLYKLVGPMGGSNIPQVDTAPSFGEKVVNCFNREHAQKMWERRCEKEYNRQADELSHNAVTHTYLYAFHPIYPTPEKISFSMSGSYPPDNKDKARIVFRNVPIQ